MNSSRARLPEEDRFAPLGSNSLVLRSLDSRHARVAETAPLLLINGDCDLGYENAAMGIERGLYQLRLLREERTKSLRIREEMSALKGTLGKER